MSDLTHRCIPARALSVLALVLTPALALAQTVADFNVIPVVAHTTGLGDPPTYWVSDVTVHNPTEWAMTIGFAFIEEGKTYTFPPAFPVTRQLGAKQTVLFEDVLGTLFGYTSNIKGTLFVASAEWLFPENPERSRTLVISRTYNTGGVGGTYGQSVSSAQLLINYTSALSLVTGVRHDASYRSNLGILNASTEEVTIRWAVRAAGGALVKSGAQTMPPISMRQWTFASLGVAKQSGVLTVELWLDAADVTADPCAVEMPNAFIAYVSKVDGNPTGTGDAEHLHAIPREFPECFCEDRF